MRSKQICATFLTMPFIKQQLENVRIRQRGELISTNQQKT